MKLFRFQFRAMLWFLIIAGAINLMPRHIGVTQEARIYMEMMKDLTDNNLGNFNNVGIVDLHGSIAGNCRVTPLGSDILLDKEVFTKSSPQRIILLLGHELLHCEKGYDHVKNDKFFWDGCEAHIMSTSLPSEYCTKKYFKMYINQMKEL